MRFRFVGRVGPDEGLPLADDGREESSLHGSGSVCVFCMVDLGFSEVCSSKRARLGEGKFLEGQFQPRVPC